MTMRRQGLADAGKASQEYRELVKSLQKRVSTAIEVEEIPPGYVLGIRSYFDSLNQQTVDQQAAPVEVDESGASTLDDNLENLNEVTDDAS